ncbi:hypothetical protein [Actinoplanes flavus]|uniref:Uncharacterized protein n=1 Tax=Actinoplanes flavus TaxID=2820290 RepID=A0ABS3UTQ5_9ACTN|nr:hypothetical protein [Actinoplanes flavus]MBO3741937.1 hypothetical protein [Actinoplanes flavus]
MLPGSGQGAATGHYSGHQHRRYATVNGGTRVHRSVDAVDGHSSADAIQAVPWSVHTLAIAAADVRTAVLWDNRTDEVEELRRFASSVPSLGEML